MAVTQVLRCAALLIVVGLTFACSAPRPNESGYADELHRARAAKDAFLQNDADSPMPTDKHTEFLPLSYYDPDIAYRIPATLALADEPVLVDMPTSTGTIDRLQMVGVLEFFLDGEPRTLSAFVSAGGGSLFVPFRDETSGGRKRMGPAGISILTRRRPGSTRSTSTGRTIRTATSTRSSSVLCRRRRTG